MTDGKQLNVRASGVVAIAVACSRILGLIREMLFAGLFGTSLMGLFTVAFRAPNLLRDLFAEGALSTSFITVFSQKIEREGTASAWRLASKVMTLAVVCMSAISLLGVIFAGPFIRVLAMGFDAGDARQVVFLTRIMFPFILLVSLAALVMGMLNARGVFGIPAMASSFFNIGSILGGALLGWILDPGFGPRALTGLAVGTLLGGLLQLGVQLPALRRAGFHFFPDFRWRDPGIREILHLLTPSVIAASAVQVNVLVNTSFASFLGGAAVAWLNYAFRLMQLPLGIFGVAVATITLPVAARLAAAGGRPQFGATLGQALRLSVFLTLPAATGLYLLARPIISLIYERGEFRTVDSLQTGLALQCYAFGLVAYAWIKVLGPAFYTIGRRWTPMMVSFASIALNLTLNYLFIFHWQFGHRGLAASVSLSAAFNFLALYLLMRRHAGHLDTPRLVGTTLRCGVACVALGFTCVVGVRLGTPWLNSPQLLLRAVSLLALVGLASLAYFTTCLLLRIEETQTAARLVAKRFRGRTK